MRRLQAEQEADHKNLQDERRDRLVFYALDESAGLSEDAWQVATRLRRADEFQWELPAESTQNDVDAPLADEVAPPEPLVEERAPREAAAPPLEPVPTGLYEQVPETAEPPATHDPAAQTPARARSGVRLVRAWGYFVMLVGVVFVAATLAVSLGFRTYLQIGPLIVAALVAAGVFAIWVGAQIAKPPR